MAWSTQAWVIGIPAVIGFVSLLAHKLFADKSDVMKHDREIITQLMELNERAEKRHAADVAENERLRTELRVYENRVRELEDKLRDLEARFARFSDSDGKDSE